MDFIIGCLQAPRILDSARKPWECVPRCLEAMLPGVGWFEGSTCKQGTDHGALETNFQAKQHRIWSSPGHMRQSFDMDWCSMFTVSIALLEPRQVAGQASMCRSCLSLSSSVLVHASYCTPNSEYVGDRGCATKVCVLGFERIV
jgi:hypothetical protein